MNTFAAGTTYTTTSIANSECVYSWTVVRRTAKTITLTGSLIDGEKRVKVRTDEQGEWAMPLGTYSMAPVMFGRPGVTVAESPEIAAVLAEELDAEEVAEVVADAEADEVDAAELLAFLSETTETAASRALAAVRIEMQDASVRHMTDMQRAAIAGAANELADLLAAVKA